MLLGLVSVMSVALSCKPKKADDTADAGAPPPPPSATASAPAAVPEPEAKNADQLTRFPGETKLDNEKAKLERTATSVREDPPSGKVFAVLPKGTEVVKMATHQGFVLINFASPQNASEHLAGWVGKDAFTTAPAATGSAKPAPAPLKCATGQTMLWGEPPFCEKVCAANSDCGAGALCLGVAPLFVNKLPGKAVKFCVGEKGSTPAADGGAPAAAPADAGSATIADAAAAAIKDSGAAAEAGGGGGATVNFTENSQNGACRNNRVLGADKLCRIPCATDADCTKVVAGSVCTTKSGVKVCAAVR